MAGTPEIRKSTAGGMGAFILENDLLRAVIVPEMGARIISLIYKPTETEFAWHNPNTPIRKPTREVEFEDVSGFFDCVPTTEPCVFKGKQLPAAGEVGFDPWKIVRVVKGAKKKGTGVKLERACKIYPLIVRKQITVEAGKPVLRLNYEIENTSNRRLEYHYSAHNTMRVTPYHRIVLPSEVTKLKLGMAITDRFGNLGDEVGWPIATDRKEHKSVDISKIGSPLSGTGENLYTQPLKERWCALVNTSRKEALGLTWDSPSLPYLLVWINNGGWRDYYHVALEPLTGRPDNLDVAVNQWKEFATLPARGKVDWEEHFILGHEIENVARIENDQFIQS